MARSRAQLSAGVDGVGGTGGGALALVASCCTARRLVVAGGLLLVLAVVGLWANVASAPPPPPPMRPAVTPLAPADGDGDEPGSLRRETRERDPAAAGVASQPVAPPASNKGSGADAGGGGGSPVVIAAASASNTPPPPPASDAVAVKQPQPAQAQAPPAPIMLPFKPLTKEPVEVRRSMLSPPHGAAELADLMVTEKRRRELEHDIATGAIAHTWTLTPRQACDLELLMTGGFTPLRGFMDALTYASVLAETRLPKTADHDSVVWPMPITLDVPGTLAPELAPGARLALRDAYHNLIAVMTVSDKYTPDRVHEASVVFGTTDDSHPGERR